MSLRQVTFDFSATNVPPSGVPGTPPLRQRGFAQFMYGKSAGQLKKLSWDHCILFPEYFGATGINWFCTNNTKWTFVPTEDPSGGAVVSTATGGIDFANANYAGFTNGNAPNINHTQSYSNDVTHVPGSNGDGTWSLKFIGSTETVDDANTNVSSKIAYWNALAFASEIAQKCVYLNMNETTEEFASIQTPTLCTPNAGVPTYAVIQVVSYPVSSSYEYTATGIPLLGYFAWEYDNYFSEVQYINATNVFSKPQGSGVTGFYVIPKLGVNLNVTLGVNTYEMMSMTTTLGEINLLAGKLSGLGINP